MKEKKHQRRSEMNKSTAVERASAALLLNILAGSDSTTRRQT